MADDGGVALVEDRARLEDRFCRPEDLLHTPQLAVGERDRQGRQPAAHLSCFVQLPSGRRRHPPGIGHPAVRSDHRYVLLAALTVRGGASDEFCHSGQTTLGYLSLFFVPPGVGIIQYLPLLRAHWLPVLLGLIVSTAPAMASGALVMQSVERLRQRHRTPIMLNASAGGEA